MDLFSLDENLHPERPIIKSFDMKGVKIDKKSGAIIVTCANSKYFIYPEIGIDTLTIRKRSESDDQIKIIPSHGNKIEIK